MSQPTDAGSPPAAAPSSPARGEAAPATTPRPRVRSTSNLPGPWVFRRVAAAKAAAEPWLPATVPGCVHTDLFANGKIGDPFYRLNEKDQQWIDRESWEYRTTQADAELLSRNTSTSFHGLDTYADSSSMLSCWDHDF